MTCEARLVSLDGEKAQIGNEKDALAAKERILKTAFKVQSVKMGEKLKRAQPPFTTSSLQQEASRKLNFSTAKTMQVVQQLYEGIDLGKAGTVGLVTYIRTDSVRVSTEADLSAPSMVRSTALRRPTSTRDAKTRRTPTRPSVPPTWSIRPTASSPF